MLMTTSAPAQAWATAVAAVPPAASSLPSEAATTSKPATECPAFRRFCAIGIPILPSPTNPIRAILFSPAACLTDLASAVAGDQPVVIPPDGVSLRLLARRLNGQHKIGRDRRGLQHHDDGLL